MQENKTTREIEIMWEIHYYHPETPPTRHEPGSKEELEYNAWFVVQEYGKEVLTLIPEDMRIALNLEREIIDYIKDREECMRGREEAEEYINSKGAVLYKLM